MSNTFSKENFCEFLPPAETVSIYNTIYSESKILAQYIYDLQKLDPISPLGEAFIEEARATKSNQLNLIREANTYLLLNRPGTNISPESILLNNFLLKKS